MLNDIKLLLGITDDTSKDALIQLLMKQCTFDAQLLTGETEWADKLYIIERMVIERYNRIGTEGLKSISTDGINETYSDYSYSDGIMGLLRSFRRLRTY